MSAFNLSRCPFEPLPKMWKYGGASSGGFKPQSPIKAAEVSRTGMEHYEPSPPSSRGNTQHLGRAKHIGRHSDGFGESHFLLTWAWRSN